MFSMKDLICDMLLFIYLTKFLLLSDTFGFLCHTFLFIELFQSYLCIKCAGKNYSVFLYWIITLILKKSLMKLGVWVHISFLVTIVSLCSSHHGFLWEFQSHLSCFLAEEISFVCQSLLIFLIVFDFQELYYNVVWLKIFSGLLWWRPDWTI